MKSIMTKVYHQVWRQVPDEVADQVWDQVGYKVYSQVWNNVYQGDQRSLQIVFYPVIDEVNKQDYDFR